jgi:hypothetical protein
LINKEAEMAEHSTPICIMSDVETPFRIKLSQNSPNRIARDPLLTNSEFIDKIRPFMGNPFYAPGTLGAKSMQKLAEQKNKRPSSNTSGSS